MSSFVDYLPMAKPLHLSTRRHILSSAGGKTHVCAWLIVFILGPYGGATHRLLVLRTCEVGFQGTCQAIQRYVGLGHFVQSRLQASTVLG
jgi:hypothetical protein